ncbi:tripartite tricarboxylate transporter substrate binding protein [Acetobacteraceae bacterium H6797]|nr:tripartite tricarboxylate transporter substrate binding protein [Acetobacteraceae bacterium H6797]
MPISRRGLVAASLAIPALSRGALAQEANWPSRPVRIIVPYAPGGSNDAVARPLAEKLFQKFGQPFVVENRPGAGSTIGSAVLTQSPADGYTLMVTSSTFATSAAVQPTPYDASRDFAGVALLASGPMMVLASPSLPVNSLQELVAYARAKPDAIDFGSSGPGSINQLATELFAQTTGLKMQHVPYRGMGPALTDLIAGNIQILVTSFTSAAGIVREKRVKLLAWTGDERPPGLPEAPSVKQAGIDYEAALWWGLIARTGTPQGIVDKLNAAANEALNDEKMKSYLAGEGAIINPQSAAAYDRYLKADLTRWRETARKANIRVE